MTATKPAAAPMVPFYPPTVSPAPKPLPLTKFLFSFVSNPLRALPVQVYEERVVSLQSRPGFQVTWITSPDLIERILVTEAETFTKTPVEMRVLGRALGQGVLTASGAHWKWQRRTLAPLFRHKEILSYVPAMGQCADEQIQRWRQTQGSSVRQIEEDMTDATFTIIARTMLAGGEPAEAQAIKRANSAFLSRISWELAFALMRIPEWVPHPGSYRIWRSTRQLRSSVRTIVQRRRAEQDRSQENSSDLLGRLLEARDAETGAPMDDELIVDNLLTLLEAGHETTAKALTWTLYILARAPEWQDRVRREVTQVAGNDTLTAEHVEKLIVTEQVLKEAMRLYPPAPVIVRTPVRPATFDDVLVPAGSQIVIPIYALHRHRKLWDDGDLFNPERFTPEFEASLPRTQYMPFGAGQRICLGMSFALVEAKILLAAFVRAARFGWDGKHQPEPVSRITLKPKGGMPLIVTPI